MQGKSSSGTRPRPRCAYALCAALLAGCAPGQPQPRFDPILVGAAAIAARPYELRKPRNYDPAQAAPLVILLHGYGGNAEGMQRLMSFGDEADARGLLLVALDGLIDSDGLHFWHVLEPHDVEYVDAVITDVAAHVKLDERRVYVVGYSNGAMLAHRLGCELSSRIAAFTSISGTMLTPEAYCTPSKPIAVLEIHGDQDDVVPFGGRGGSTPLPSVPNTLAIWTKRNACTAPLAEAGQSLDLESDLAGDETQVARAGGCTAPVELWRVTGGGHAHRFQPAAAHLVFDFLMRNVKAP